MLSSDATPAAAPLAPLPRAADWPTALGYVLARPRHLRVHFQPIADLRRGEVCGYEALARFPPGVLPEDSAPGAWLYAAAQHGLSGPLEALLVRAALASRAVVTRDRFLAVNVSPAALVTPEVGGAFLEQARLDGIVVELTGGADAGDPLGVREIVDHLRRRGARIAVDDAGARFGTLQRITALRPQFIKIDAAVIADVDHDETRVAMVRTLAGFAARIDAVLIAEGVERLEQLDTLVRLGVPLAQGFAIGVPAVAMTEMDRTLARHLRDRAAAVPTGAGLAVSGIGELADPSPSLVAPAHRADIAAVLARHPAATGLALLDERGRPVAVLERTAFLHGLGEPTHPLVLPAATTVRDAARRAVARPPGHRYDPIACVDGLGRYAGLVPIDRLIERLAG
jgi:EAL domain-containing protein (putative c-di-GMP-specific phosphodiesterase class I)